MLVRRMMIYNSFQFSRVILLQNATPQTLIMTNNPNCRKI